MPREIVRNCDNGNFEVKVGWGAPGASDVQLGVESDDGKSLFWLLFGKDSKSLVELGQAIRTVAYQHMDKRGDTWVEWGDADFARDILDALDTVSYGGYRGLWTSLDRMGCNRLIKLIRRARDVSFGKDE